MSVEFNKAAIRRFYEKVVNARDLGLADELLAANIHDHAAQGEGIDEFKELFNSMMGIFENLQITVEDLIAENDFVAARITSRALQSGTFRGFPPSARDVTFGGMDIFRFENGKVVERWACRDFLGMLKQAGHFDR